MATYITEGYPSRLTDRQIEQHIKEYSDEIVKFRGNINFTSAYVPLIQLGQAELQNRQNKKVFRLTLFISILSLLVSFAALFVSYSSMDSSSSWEQSQIELLKELKETMSNSKVSVEAPKVETNEVIQQADDTPKESSANKLLKSDS
ncbi:hypothetical protein [Vibrio parahaemolyticus]|uniref:hypothetical protein n=1 Tax=Vibrio parahaemolyticus TaxID=670 RepID=UPI0029E29AB2|nr:hypothetical protein [Vibrio parahaemolyticus]